MRYQILDIQNVALSDVEALNSHAGYSFQAVDADGFIRQGKIVEAGGWRTDFTIVTLWIRDNPYAFEFRNVNPITDAPVYVELTKQIEVTKAEFDANMGRA